MNRYYIDGYTVGSNPSKEGGYTITDSDGKIIEQRVLKSPSGEKTITNNYTEFAGLCRAVEIASPGSTIITDSMNNISWINMKFPKKSKRKDLKPMAEIANQEFVAKSLIVEWVGRDYNLAGIVNEEMFSN